MTNLMYNLFSSLFYKYKHLIHESLTLAVFFTILLNMIFIRIYAGTLNTPPISIIMQKLT